MQTDSKFRLWHNLVSMAGLTIAAISMVLLITFGAFVLVSPSHNPYVDIVGYMILPATFIFGLAIVPVGMWLQYRALTSQGVVGKWIAGLRIDLRNPNHLRIIIGFLALNLFVVFPIVGVSAYHGYHYTESTEFCANVCHAVMEPQGVSHAHSPHARVACAECHIGSGASWFVKSKLSGVRQVFAVWLDSYSRPIPPAITELRPARDTCEECHWPSKFFGSQLRELVRFGADEHNTRRELRMILYTGGHDESIGRVEGIHMHMAFSGPIDYVALDEHLQEIPWVRYQKPDGETLIYRSDGLSSDAPPPDGILRRIDCMDCHNRGAHHFRSPQVAVDLHMESGLIDPSLPFIKREAVAAIDASYPDREAASQAIRERLVAFYREHYPQVQATEMAAIDRAIESVQQIYAETTFPWMNVRWHTYPENIGHLTSAGCFRCHDGKHVNQHGVPISSDCGVCHTFLNPVSPGSEAFVEGPFQHSMSLQFHENMRCEQCHTGGSLPVCGDCHATGNWLEERGRERFDRVRPPDNRSKDQQP